MANWQVILDAAAREAESQNVEMTVNHRADCSGRIMILLTLEERLPRTLEVHVRETVATKDKVGP